VEPRRALFYSRHPYPENICWLIEFSNASLSKDLEVKHQTYAADIPAYWLVNLFMSVFDRKRRLRLWGDLENGRD